MSIKLMTAVWQMRINHTDKLVLLALADNANDDNGLCWPSIQTLCKKTCLSERGVQASIARLVNTKTLERIIRKGKSSHYFVIPPQFVHPASDAPTPAPRAPPPPHHVREGGAPRAPRTINEPSSEPSLTQNGIFQPRRKSYVRPKSSREATEQIREKILNNEPLGT